MKKIIAALAFCLASTSARAGSLYDLQQNASTATLALGGVLKVGTSTSAPTVTLNGTTGGVTSLGLTVSTVTGNNSGMVYFQSPLRAGTNLLQPLNNYAAPSAIPLLAGFDNTSVGDASGAPVISINRTTTATGLPNNLSYGTVAIEDYVGSTTPYSSIYHLTTLNSTENNMFGLQQSVTVAVGPTATANAPGVWGIISGVNNGGFNVPMSNEFDISNSSFDAHFPGVHPDTTTILQSRDGNYINMALNNANATSSVNLGLLVYGGAGYDVGIEDTQFLTTGLYLNSSASKYNPHAGTGTPEKVGIRFGPSLLNLLRVDNATQESFGLNVEGSSLVWRNQQGGASNYWLSMSTGNNSLSLQSDNVTIDALGGTTLKNWISATSGTFTNTAGASVVVSSGISLGNVAPASNGTLGYKQSSNDLIVGNGSSTQTVHLGAFGSWTPTWAGFSANPTVGFAIFTQVGKHVYASWNITGGGTSNATTHTITLPFVANRLQPGAGLVRCVDNGGAAAYGEIDTRAGSNIADLYANAASAAWTNTGTSYCQGFVEYEAQ